MTRRELVTRLREAEETLHAIRSGEVDAIVVNGPGGEKDFTLQGADHIYRVFVERMNEGAAVLSSAAVSCPFFPASRSTAQPAWRSWASASYGFTRVARSK